MRVAVNASFKVADGRRAVARERRQAGPMHRAQGWLDLDPLMKNRIPFGIWKWHLLPVILTRPSYR